TLALAVCIYNPWLSALSAIIFVAFALTSLGITSSNDGNVWSGWAILWLALPLPLGLDGQLTAQLQRLSSRASSTLIDFLQIPHILMGNAIQLTDRELFVDEACSGIVSLFSIIACSTIFGVWKKRSLVHVIAMTAMGILWATGMNVIRILTIVIFHHRWQINLAEGALHELLGLTLFMVTFGCLMSTDQLLSFALAPIRSQETKQMIAPASTSVRSTSVVRFATLAFAILSLLQLSQIGYAIISPQQPSNAVDIARKLSESSLPKTLADFSMVNYAFERRTSGDIFGEFSHTFTYRDVDGTDYLVSFDFPFGQGWHELTVCYQGIGWELTEREIQTTDNSWRPIAVTMFRHPNSHGLLVFSAFDEYGNPVSPPASKIGERIWRLLRRRSPYVAVAQQFQVQVLVTGNKPIPQKSRDRAGNLLLTLRETLRQQLAIPQ
ncbi:MAG: exosortase U, partial [Planctomycetota bacterium]